MFRFPSITLSATLLLASIASPGAGADPASQPPAPAASTSTSASSTDASVLRAHYAKLQVQLRERKGPFKDLDAGRSGALAAHLKRVLSRLQGIERTTDLSPPDQVELINAIESIRAIVTEAEDGRMVCERVLVTGSRLPTMVCKTVAERREERQQAERTLRGNQICTDSWGSGACRKD